jgi:HEAT repeat protein|nr:HEAT repeat domain-containing protein [Kofleriaceae bacterium]
MAKSLGGAVIELLESERVELRTAAATVLAAVGKGDKAVETALTARLADPDGVVRRIALDALSEMGTGGIASKLVPLLHGDDDELAARAASVLAQQGAAAEATLRKEVAAGPVQARRVMAQLLIRRGTVPAVEAVLDQLGDPEFGEQALQLVRAELDSDNAKLAGMIEKEATARATERAKDLKKHAPKADKADKKSKKANGHAAAPAPAVDPEAARLTSELGALLRLVGYLARTSTQSFLLGFTDADRPRPIRLAAIAGLRRIVASSEAKGTEKVIESLIELADGDDPAVAQGAVDTLRGARIPEALAKPFAALAKSKNVMAQKLAMERMPAGGGASAVKALVDALAGDDPTARDAAARGLSKAPEAVLPVTRALLASTNEQVARRFAGVLRSHRGNVSNQAIDELVERVREYIDAHFKGKATADQIVLERIVAELVADLAPAKHVELLFERAKRLRKQGKSVEAFGSLKPLLRSHADLDAAIDNDQRYLLALLALEAAGEGLIRTMTGNDPVFDQFSRLAASGFPVAKQLARENELPDEALYALGFRLIESGDGSNEELGAELLQGIIDERPRSKLAKAAKNKLKLTGHLDD